MTDRTGPAASPTSPGAGAVVAAEIDAVTFAERLAAGAPVLIPVGATEQHGPHLPLGTDAMLADAMARGAAEHVAGVVMPAFSWGYKSQQRSGGGDHLTGSTSLDAAALIGQTQDVLRSLLRQGARRIVLVNGHFENTQFLYEGIDLALRELDAEARGASAVLLLSYWDYVSEETVGRVFPDGFGGWDVEHGGVLETSLMLHLHPHLVRMDRAPSHGPARLRRFDRLPILPERTPASGCLSSPIGASADSGRLLHEQVVADLGAELLSELGDGTAGAAAG